MDQETLYVKDQTPSDTEVAAPMAEESPNNEEQQESGSGSFVKNARATKDGDIIAAQIGAEAQNVVVGKNIIQIGSIQIPRYLAVILVAGMIIVAAAAVRLVYMFLPETVMPDDSYNIAVAELIAFDVSKRPIRENKDAFTIPSSIVKFIESETQFLQDVRSTTGKAVTVWGPEQGITGVMSSTVANRAAELKADVMVYGVLQQQSENVWSLEPKFFLHSKAVNTAEEILGPYALGTPIEYTAGNDASEGELNKQFNARLKALTKVIWGLSYYELNSEENYRKATEIFEQAVQDPMWGSAKETLGQEILYLFLGSSYLQQVFFAGQNDPDQSKQRLLLEKAQQAYEAGLSINNNYVRLNNGLGRVHLQVANLARIQTPPCGWDWSELDKAQEFFTTALKAPEELKFFISNIDFVAHHGLGRIFFAKGFCQRNREDLEQAIEHYQASIALFEKEPLKSRTDTVATAHMELGNIILTLNTNNPNPTPDYLQTVTNNFQQVVELGSRSEASIQNRVLAQQVMPTLFVVLCYAGQTQNFTKTLDSFVNTLPNSMNIRTEIVTVVNKTAKQVPNLPKECQNGITQ